MSRPVRFTFRLYVAGQTQNSVRAIANLRTLCQTHMAGRHEIEIIDVFKHPRLALADQIFMTPTLIRQTPAPVRRFVGILNETNQFLEALGFEAVSA
jgi:circadian clock protein KaiB